MAKIKIRNSQTGEIREIEDTQLGQFGITPPQAQQPQQQPQDVQSIVDMLVGQAAQGMQSKGMNVPTPQPQNPLADMGVIPPTQPTENPQQKYITGYSLQEHMDALNQARAAGDKAAIKTITEDYNREYAYQKEMVKPPVKTAKEKAEEAVKVKVLTKQKLEEAGIEEQIGVDQKKVIGMAKSGVKAIQDAREMYKQDPSLLMKQIVPGHFFSRKFDAALYNAADTVLRLRTGAQANPSEIRGYMERLGPSFGDDPDDVAYKFNQFEQILIDSAGKSKEELLGNKKSSNTTKSKKQIKPTQSIQTSQVVPSAIAGSAQDSFNQSTRLAMMAAKEKDPARKQELLNQSRQLAGEGRGMSANEGQVDPLTNVLGRAQEFLGNTEALPIANSILTSIIGAGNPVATGVGATIGKREQQMLKKGGTESLIATPKESGEALLTGAEYAVVSKLFGMGGKYLKNAVKTKSVNPNAIAGYLREEAAAQTPTINAGNIIKTGNKWAKLDPTTAKVWNEIKPGITNKMNTKDLLDLLTSWGDRTWTISGDVKDKAAASLMKNLYGTARETIREQAPMVAKYTKDLANIKGFPKLIQNAQRGTWFLLKLLGIKTLAGQ